MSASIVGLTPPPTRREELAEFLRHLRERTTPESVGLELIPSARRRTPGLRREEVVQLAGVGLSWYTWLEQGRDITPSAGVLDALARVFAATGSERDHLFHLAGVAAPPDAQPCPQRAPGELARWVAAMQPMPAYLINERTDILAANPAVKRIIGVPIPTDGEPAPNLLRHLYTAADLSAAQTRSTARLTLARFRAAHARHYDDPAFRALIEELLDGSPAFRKLWPWHEVLDSQLGTKRIEDPELGALTLHHMQSIPTSHPELRLAQYVPADAATRAALESLD